ncbi:MAG: hypothetical protein Q8S33_04580 [Myxococcales bacterium]|nr:hypothetical protein [Myxococcales bacterium]
MRPMLVCGVAVSLSMFSACGHAPGRDEREPQPCDCAIGVDVPAAGTVTLRARSLGPDTDETYWKASASFEHGGVTGSVTQTNNDWDLLFGNNTARDPDLFQVNTGSDDRSFIVDLGEVQLRDAPATIDFSTVPPQTQVNLGPEVPSIDVRQRDHVPVVEGHVYWVRTADDDSRLITLVGVQTHVRGQSVTLAWFRSREAERFVFDWPEK